MICINIYLHLTFKNSKYIVGLLNEGGGVWIVDFCIVDNCAIVDFYRRRPFIMK